MASCERVCTAAADVDYGGSGGTDGDWRGRVGIEIGFLGGCGDLGCSWGGGKGQARKASIWGRGRGELGG